LEIVDYVIQSLIQFLDYAFPIIIFFIVFIRLITPLTSKVNFMDKALNTTTIEEYRRLRDHLITLVSFTLAAIALISSRTDLDKPYLQFGLAYLSIAMFSFFIGSYLFTFR
jgi:hypothetical protein